MGGTELVHNSGFMPGNMSGYAYAGAAAGSIDLQNPSIFGEMAPYTPVLLGGAAGERYMSAMTGEAPLNFNNLNTADIAYQDREKLQTLTKTLKESRILGKRWREHERVENILDKSDPNTVMALTREYAKAGGGPPDLLIQDSMGVLSCIGLGRRTKPIKLLANAAVEGRDANVAAMLIKRSGDGLGVAHETVKQILIDSKKKMSEPEHAHWVSAVANSYEKQNGESFNDFIDRKYSIIPLTRSLFGNNANGDELETLIDNSVQNTYKVNPRTAMHAMDIQMTGLM